MWSKHVYQEYASLSFLFNISQFLFRTTHFAEVLKGGVSVVYYSIVRHCSLKWQSGRRLGCMGVGYVVVEPGLQYGLGSLAGSCAIGQHRDGMRGYESVVARSKT